MSTVHTARCIEAPSPQILVALMARLSQQLSHTVLACCDCWQLWAGELVGSRHCPATSYSKMGSGGRNLAWRPGFTKFKSRKKMLCHVTHGLCIPCDLHKEQEPKTIAIVWNKITLAKSLIAAMRDFWPMLRYSRINTWKGDRPAPKLLSKITVCYILPRSSSKESEVSTNWTSD